MSGIWGRNAAGHGNSNRPQGYFGQPLNATSASLRHAHPTPVPSPPAITPSISAHRGLRKSVWAPTSFGSGQEQAESLNDTFFSFALFSCPSFSLCFSLKHKRTGFLNLWGGASKILKQEGQTSEIQTAGSALRTICFNRGKGEGGSGVVWRFKDDKP